MSTTSEAVIEDVIVYGRIACVFSFGLFLESVWTKVLQAVGNMKVPMFAQIAGAAVNIVLDPLLIFGVWVFPEMGIAGAAVATVAGQIVAALIVMKGGFRKSPALRLYPRHRKSPALRLYPRHTLTIFRLGIPNILMQAAYTFYILGLNLILSGFSDQAVTALGLYYNLLQVADLLLHPLGRHADVHRARHQLQLCRQGYPPLQKDAVGVRPVRRRLHGGGAYRL